MEEIIEFRSLKVDNDMKWEVVELTTNKRKIRVVINPIKNTSTDGKIFYTFDYNLKQLCNKYNINIKRYYGDKT